MKTAHSKVSIVDVNEAVASVSPFALCNASGLGRWILDVEDLAEFAERHELGR